MTNYPFCDLAHEQFEDLTIKLMKYLLGDGISSFTEGPDGGRDGRFVGEADHYPSDSGGWDGKWIIQAKHTSRLGASCSDQPFLRDFKEKEIPRIRALVQNGELDFYLMVTNRKKPGGADATLRGMITEELKHDKHGIIGYEDLCRNLESLPDLVEFFGLNKNFGPLRFQPEELAKLVSGFFDAFPECHDVEPDPDKSYTDLERKNNLNKIDDPYADHIKRNSESYFPLIDQFLGSPVNKQFNRKYRALVTEMNERILSEKLYERGLAKVLTGICETASERNPQLGDNRRLLNTFVHYMYCSCDIGRRK